MAGEALELHIKHVAESLHASEEEIDNGKLQMDHIIQLFQQTQNINIKKCEVICGTAKEISIVGHIDFECFVFVDASSEVEEKNDQTDDMLASTIQHFEDTLVENTYIQREEIKKIPIQNPNMMKFNYRGINFDIIVVVVTTAMLSEFHLDEESCVSELQAGIILSSYKNNSKLSVQKLQELEPGLCFLIRKFMKEQAPFVCDIARLGKYWNNTLILDKEMEDSFMHVRLAIIELIAIAAGGEKTTHLKAFRNFLQKIRDIKSMKLTFSSQQSFYKVTDIPCEFRTAPPFLISPVNPHHNYLKDMSSELLQKFSTFAEVTLTRLDQAEHVARSSAREYDLGKIFEQQPKLYYF